MMERLKYTSSERMYEGVIVEVTDGGVTIDLEGRRGQLKIPLRMLISDNPPQVGQIVGFLMTFPEVIDSKRSTDSKREGDEI